ncbi:MAG: Gfo/Idh/MocA family oxidoreductase [Chloroflexi bacterium]|uniref:Gfo/Idh/MocA family protein n=1 Tax=Candidatus Flexifilum breve TaxID=3140694 RepID=UPI003135D79E|nr:Gfo/Idh/MocA family oxidoreductase [Chloroflexota bacterium]
MRIGIMGTGDVAGRHAAVINSLKDEGVEIVALSNRTEEKARAFAAKYAPEAAIYTENHALLDEARLDLVVICLPPFAHTDEVERAAANGIHILMEKPIALAAEQAWRMVDAVERAGIKTQVGFQFRFGEAVEAFKALQAEGKTGGVALFNGRYFCNALHASWWRDRDKSGGQVIEQAIHLFDLMRYFMGQPVAVYSRQTNLFHSTVPGYTSEDTSATTVTFANGGMGVITATNNAVPGKWIGDYRVVAEKLTADFASANMAAFTHTDQPDTPVTKIDSLRDMRVAMLRDLLTAIQSGGQTRTPLRDGATILELVLAARRSAEERREVAL